MTQHSSAVSLRSRVRTPTADESLLSFGAILRAFRHNARLTQQALAERSTLGVRSISDLERGISRTPQRASFDLLAAALDLTPADRAVLEAAAYGPLVRVAPAAGSAPVSSPHIPLAPRVGKSAAATLSKREALFTAASASLLVGREREQRVLHECLAAAHAGRGGLVLISGEAGVGKTTLVDALGQEVEGALVLTGRCFDLTEAAPYGPWLDLFARYHLADMLPPLPQAFAQRGTIGAVSSQLALFDQIRAFLGAIAAQQPVVLLLDDLHWADPASLDVLRFLARDLTAMPLLIVATYRSEEVRQNHPLYVLLPLLVREAAPTRCTLHRLTEADVCAWVTTHYRLTEADTARLVTYLYARANGNAFFTAELLRSLEEERVLDEADNGWTLHDLADIRVPALLRQVIDARLTRLGADTGRLLAIAAVIGQEVSLDLWQAVSGADAETLLDQIERAVAARVLGETANGVAVTFVHALIRDALYEGIRVAQRRVWHREVAEALVAMPDPNPDMVAHHFAQAGDPRVVSWLIAAGEQAQRAYANKTAIARFEAALPLLTGIATAAQRAELHVRLVKLYLYAPWALRHAEESVRLACESGDEALAALAQSQRGFTRAFIDLGKGLREVEAGRAILRTLPPTAIARLERINGGSPPLRESGHLLAQLLAVVGRYAAAVEYAHVQSEGLRSDHESSDATASIALGVAYAGMGQPHAAHAAFMNGRDWYGTRALWGMTGSILAADVEEVVVPYETDNREKRAHLASEAEQYLGREDTVLFPFSTCIARLSLLVLEGEWNEARAIAQAARAAGFTGWYGGNARFVAAVAYGQGDKTLVQSLVHAVFPLGSATEPGAARFQNALSLQRLAAAQATDAGDLARARAWLEAHDRWLVWSGAVLGRADGCLAWAAYYRSAGDLVRAKECAERALTAATQPRQPLALLATHRLLGELATEQDRRDDAAMHLNASLALADACAAPYERALTLLAHAELRVVMGDANEALALLDEARILCVPLGAKPALARADALTARLAPRDTPLLPLPYPANLTEREVEILRLLAAGRSNREIGADLGLSVRTVERHINNIYAKTHAHGRAAATAFAIQRGVTKQ
ncbi:MAG: AAA family ATPase [Chloroflexota bacterium]|nr:AAA family ATPase [Chloroflexota bacterium]